MSIEALKKAREALQLISNMDPIGVRAGDLGRAARIAACALAAIDAEAKPVVRMPPFGSKRAAALALYRPPFKFRMGYIHDAGGHMVADQDGFGPDSKVIESVAARVRGWGRIGYMPDAEALQDEVGAVIADALTAYWNSAEVWGLTIGEQG